MEQQPSKQAGAKSGSRLSLKGRALAYLARREHSRVELARKLKPHAESEDKLQALLDELASAGWLSDERFAESVVHRRAGRFGTRRLLDELKQHALDETLLERVDQQLRESEAARAKAVWEKKYGVMPTTFAERAKQARFLAGRGFSHAVIARILNGLEEVWED